MTQAADVGTEAGAGHPPSRRDRVRAATTEEIIQTARRLLVDSGPDAVTLRAIAREMGMTAPGLYRYFDNRDELVRHVCASIFTELGADIHRAIQAANAAAGAPDPAIKLTAKMVAACQEFRRWSLNHRAEFSLLFGVPLPGLDDGRYDIADECALAFAGTFFTLFLELWTTAPFPVPEAADIDPGLPPARPLPRRAGRWHSGRRGTHLPALLDGAVRRGGHGGVRPHEVRAGGSGAHVRAHPRRPGRFGRIALPGCGLRRGDAAGPAGSVSLRGRQAIPT